MSALAAMTSLELAAYAAEAADVLSPDERIQLAQAITVREHAERFMKFELLYPETGPLRRELYAKHLEFFEAGKTYRERCAMAANRVGKSFGMGGYEFTCHITGRYPDWWPGRRWHRPITAWVAGDTNETTRDIIQKILFGMVEGSGPGKRMDGTGLVPLECIDQGSINWKQGVNDLIDQVAVDHTSGGKTIVGVKSYKQGRKMFQGVELDVLWFDEEPPLSVYTEGLVRTMTTDGMTMLTYTPLEGLTETVMAFLPGETGSLMQH